MVYNHKEIEQKWQKHWLDEKTFKSRTVKRQAKFYCLDMFPYPSAAGLHVGHIEGYTASDIMSRFKRMQGFNVLHPIGWDSFGLPAEQFAIQTGNDPKEFTYKNISKFKSQIISSGMSIDWDREFATSDENYYQWTQWIFKKMYEKGLAQLKDVEVNWCEELGTVLANDEIESDANGKMISERGGYPVVKKALKQWVLKITDYAERLLNGLDKLDWPENIKEMQRNWIGKSEGALINFKVANSPYSFEVYTTRPDTIFGVTYCVIAPENKLVSKITASSEKESVDSYIQFTKQKSELDRISSKEKTGVFTGSFAINPLNNKPVPIWISDYVLNNYGTGCLMAVPAHDERDYDFAVKYELDIIQVIKSDTKLFTGDGVHINSGFLNGLDNKKATKKVINFLQDNAQGSASKTYKLRDWVFSRQRYWGEPFPVYFDEKGNILTFEDNELPLTLPILKQIKPSGDGRSPLALAHNWLHRTVDGKKITLDTNTMPQLAGSSWYFIGYILKNILGFIPLNSPDAKKEIDHWLPVDLYIGGTEHAVGHLLYARFFTMFLHDLGLCKTQEPFLKLVNQGMILGENHKKMSKSLGNTINPDVIIEEYGADTLRLYEMFLGPISVEKPWSEDALEGAYKFVKRFFTMYSFPIEDEISPEIESLLQHTIKKVTDDYSNLDFNTAISQVMIMVNEIYRLKVLPRKVAKTLLIMLNPICPHLTEELNQSVLKSTNELAYTSWPEFDESKIKKDLYSIAVSINGKLRATLEVDIKENEEGIKARALALDAIQNYVKGNEIKKIIYVSGKIINIVI